MEVEVRSLFFESNTSVEIHVLEANSCCDRVILTDDFVGGNIIAK